MEIYNNAMAQLDRFINEPGPVEKYLAIIEEKTKVKRTYIARAFVGLLCLYMVCGYFAQLICNFLGFIYPAYKSLKALETRSKEDDTRWLTYWVVFSFFSVAEFFSDFIFKWFPFYWLVKVIFLIWCYLPIQNNGTDYIYSKLIRPVFLRNEKGIDNLATRLYDEAKEEIRKQK